MKYEEFDEHDDLGYFVTKTKIIMNGNWIGFTSHPYSIVQSLRKARNKGFITD
jgi:hypothetical protein